MDGRCATMLIRIERALGNSETESNEAQMSKHKKMQQLIIDEDEEYIELHLLRIVEAFHVNFSTTHIGVKEIEHLRFNLG